MNVLGICAGYIPSVRLCGDIQLKYLESNGKLKYCFKLNNEVNSKDLIWADILYIIRGDSTVCVEYAKYCIKNKKPVIYILDDNLLEIPSNLAASKFYEKEETRNAIKKLIEMSNGFVSPSTKLIEKYGLETHKILQIIEPSLDPIKTKEKANDGKIHIGFAGSIDHSSDAKTMLGDVLFEIKNKYKDKVCIELFGTKTELSKKVELEEHPFVDSYEEYQEKMKQFNWDIGLAPLPSSYFNSFKHYNKLVEYETYGIVGIYSNVVPFTFAVKDKYNGLLVENNKESFINAIETLINDENLRTSIQKNCIEEANTKYSLEESANQLYEYLKLFTLSRTNKKYSMFKLSIKLKLSKFKYFFGKIKIYGIKTPIVILRKIKHKVFKK